jgi:hypothetical protein
VSVNVSSKMSSKSSPTMQSANFEDGFVSLLDPDLVYMYGEVKLFISTIFLLAVQLFMGGLKLLSIINVIY